MFFTLDTLLAFGAVVLIGVIIVGASIGIGKWIIWLFGTEYAVGTPLPRDEEPENSVIPAL